MKSTITYFLLVFGALSFSIGAHFDGYWAAICLPFFGLGLIGSTRWAKLKLMPVPTQRKK